MWLLGALPVGPGGNSGHPSLPSVGRGKLLSHRLPGPLAAGSHPVALPTPALATPQGSGGAKAEMGSERPHVLPCAPTLLHLEGWPEATGCPLQGDAGGCSGGSALGLASSVGRRPEGPWREAWAGFRGEEAGLRSARLAGRGGRVERVEEAGGACAWRFSVRDDPAPVQGLQAKGRPGSPPSLPPPLPRRRLVLPCSVPRVGASRSQPPARALLKQSPGFCANDSPEGSLVLHGKAWDAHPYCRTIASPGGREGHERCSRGMTAGLPSQTVSTSVHTTLCTSGWCVRACVSTEQRVCLSRGAAALSPGYRLSLTKETPFIRYTECRQAHLTSCPGRRGSPVGVGVALTVHGGGCWTSVPRSFVPA
ncbi:uncharacterized protein LOC125442521 [Sphaerodactylus townsendi]|uniref:uncharacterized protein LOC125442521 n=1 Tax=Sphaerodactylus townsendi TaxID=933632 RepID=UPI002026F26D|nr:uncharacterized protein LOC125442521 [Sphaerodactylus townsendi]